MQNGLLAFSSFSCIFLIFLFSFSLDCVFLTCSSFSFMCFHFPSIFPSFALIFLQLYIFLQESSFSCIFSFSIFFGLHVFFLVSSLHFPLISQYLVLFFILICFFDLLILFFDPCAFLGPSAQPWCILVF